MTFSPQVQTCIEASIRYFQAAVGPIPPDTAKALPLFVWDTDRLRSFPAPVELTPLARLTHFLDVPMWRLTPAHPPFTIAPIEVARQPLQHNNHYEKTMSADLHYPIDIICYEDGWRLADGYHRLLKAKVLELDSILTHLIPESAIPAILQDEDSSLSYTQTTTLVRWYVKDS